MQMSDMIRDAQSGDKAARDKLVEDNVGLVWSIVKRYLGRGYESDDLFQIGSIGLIKAIDRFDLNMDVMFSTYAIPLIQGEIKRFLRDDGLIKVSRLAKENNWKIKKARQEFENSNAREPSLEELCNITGLSIDDITMAMESDVTVDSLYKSTYDSDGRDIMIIDSIKDGKDEIEERINHIMLTQMLGKLEEQEREILRLRYCENMTQTQVGEILGMSQVKISRMEKRIIKKMREDSIRKG